MKEIGKSVLKSVGVIFYFAILFFAFTRMKIERLAGDIKIFSGLFLIFGLGMVEKSYKKESGLDAITSIELIVLAFHSLSLIYVTKILKIEFGMYLLYSGVVISIYYLIKGIVLFTKGKKEELKKLSDISDIVKEKPIKKEATKKLEKEKKLKTIENKKEKEKNKAQTKSKTVNKKTKTLKKKSKIV